MIYVVKYDILLQVASVMMLARPCAVLMLCACIHVQLIASDVSKLRSGEERNDLPADGSTTSNDNIRKQTETISEAESSTTGESPDTHADISAESRDKVGLNVRTDARADVQTDIQEDVNAELRTDKQDDVGSDTRRVVHREPIRRLVDDRFEERGADGAAGPAADVEPSAGELRFEQQPDESESEASSGSPGSSRILSEMADDDSLPADSPSDDDPWDNELDTAVQQVADDDDPEDDEDDDDDDDDSGEPVDTGYDARSRDAGGKTGGDPNAINLYDRMGFPDPLADDDFSEVSLVSQEQVDAMSVRTVVTRREDADGRTRVQTYLQTRLTSGDIWTDVSEHYDDNPPTAAPDAPEEEGEEEEEMVAAVNDVVEPPQLNPGQLEGESQVAHMFLFSTDLICCGYSGLGSFTKLTPGLKSRVDAIISSIPELRYGIRIMFDTRFSVYIFKVAIKTILWLN